MSSLIDPIFSPFQQVHFVDVDRLFIAEEGNQNAEADRGFGGGVGNNENRKNLPMLRAPETGERDQVQVYGVQNQFNRHQHDDDVAPREHADNAQQKQR